MADDLEERRLVRAQELADAGLRQLGANQYAAAEESFRAALGLAPGNPALLNNLGVALRAQKRTKEAIAEFDLAVQADPASKKARKNLFGATAGYAGAGGAIVFFLVIHALPEVERQLHLPEGVVDAIFLGSLVAAIAGLWFFGWYRRRSLSPRARAVYRQEARRERNLELARGLFKAGPPVAVVLAMVLAIAANPDVSGWWLAAGALFIVVWLFTWKRLWRAVAQ